MDLGHHAGGLRLDGDFHLHAFDEDERRAGGDGLADLDGDVDDAAGDGGFDRGHRYGRNPKLLGPGDTARAARLTNSSASRRVSAGSMMSSTTNASALRKG